MLDPTTEARGYYSLVTDLAEKVNILKGYEMAYTSPASGMLIISHGGVNYLITAEALSKTDDVDIGDELSRNKYRFDSRHAELKRRGAVI